MSEHPGKESALHYDGAEEPKVPAWALLGAIALLTAAVYYGHRLIQF